MAWSANAVYSDVMEGALLELPSAQPNLQPTCNLASNDCISRQAVIEINRSYHGQMPNEVNHRIWKEINELPSAQPERKRGKWIEYDTFATISCRCSVCGWEAHLYEDDVVGMNYCPNCGAKMDEFEEE